MSNFTFSIFPVCRYNLAVRLSRYTFIIIPLTQYFSVSIYFRWSIEYRHSGSLLYTIFINTSEKYYMEKPHLNQGTLLIQLKRWRYNNHLNTAISCIWSSKTIHTQTKGQCWLQIWQESCCKRNKSAQRSQHPPHLGPNLWSIQFWAITV